MTRHPIRDAYEYLDVDPSPEFRAVLRERFLADLSKVSDSTVPEPVGRLEDRKEPIVITAEAPVHPKPRRNVLAIAAAIVLVVGLAAVVIQHGSQSKSVDTSRDPEIAKEALIPPDGLGSQFEVSNGGLTSRAVADIAATVPECAPYLDSAFDTAARNAPTAGRIFGSLGSTLTEWVYIFPSEEAASAAMDKIAEPGFKKCFEPFWDVLIPAYAPGSSVTAIGVPSPPILPHGNRQVVLAQDTTIRVEGAESRRTIINAFVQVGRGIVYVDPVTDEHDSTDPDGSIEKGLTAAVTALEQALSSKSKG